ncbi:MAG: hypothetical protein ABH817_02465 [archaeon]
MPLPALAAAVAKKGVDKHVLQKVNMGLLGAVIILLVILLISVNSMNRKANILVGTECGQGLSEKIQESFFNTKIGEGSVYVTHDGQTIPGLDCYYTYICTNYTDPCEEDECVEEGYDCRYDEDCCEGCCKTYGEISQYSVCAPTDECEECIDYAYSCTSNESCCSDCCKELSPSSGYFECRLAEECESQCVQEGISCQYDEDCCDGYCVNGMCDDEPACIDYAYECIANADCCSDCCLYMGGHFECRFAEECAPACTITPGTCSDDEECCDECCLPIDDQNNRMCSQNEPCCNYYGDWCNTNEDCCSGHYCTDQKVCDYCYGEGAYCNEYSTCCFPYICGEQGVCINSIVQ